MIEGQVINKIGISNLYFQKVQSNTEVFFLRTGRAGVIMKDKTPSYNNKKVAFVLTLT